MYWTHAKEDRSGVLGMCDAPFVADASFSGIADEPFDLIKSKCEWLGFCLPVASVRARRSSTIVASCSCPWRLMKLPFLLIDFIVYILRMLH